MSNLKKFSHQLREMYNYVDEMRMKYAKLIYNSVINRKYVGATNDIDLPSADIFKDNKLVATAKYQMIGFYTQSTQDDIYIWYWAWTNPLLDKNIILLSKKIFNYAFDFFTDIKKYEDIKQVLELKMMFNASYFMVNKFQKDLLIEYCLYITKYKWYTLSEQAIPTKLENKQKNIINYVFLFNDIDIK